MAFDHYCLQSQASCCLRPLVRYYEKIGLLPPPARTRGNYRSYGNEHLARLSFIRRARDLGFRLEEVRELLTLSDDKGKSCEAIDRIARTHRPRSTASSPTSLHFVMNSIG
jgi:DNA-binding transcriptional MerR regulator